MANLIRQGVGAGISKQAYSLYGNIYQYPNWGRYSPQWYVEQDTETGLDTMSRVLLLRWSRTVTSQLGFVEAGVRTLAQFSVGNAYLPEYTGNNSAWGKEATDWLIEEFYPNCCNRGRAYDFQTVMFLESQMLDIDGDFLCVYGQSDTGFPKFQLIPSHRIRTYETSVYYSGVSNSDVNPSPIPGTITSDGVVFDPRTGNPVGYMVQSPDNVVNTIVSSDPHKFFSAKNSMLIYDPRYFDKGRGRPAIGSCILQALSLQEIERYLMEKLKTESMVALVEATPSGEGPLELQQTLAQLDQNNSVNGIFSPSPNVHGVEIVDGPTVRYVKAAGGDIRSLSSNTPANESQMYINRLEKHVLSTIGVPHELLFSPADINGRISDGVGEIFNRTIKGRQKILDKHAKFIISWALSKAMKEKIISPNFDENLYKVFNMTHPNEFSLNKGYDAQSDLNAWKAGAGTLDTIAKKQNTTATDMMDQMEKETVDFFKRAKRVSQETGVELPLVIQSMRESLVAKAPAPAKEMEKRP